MLEFKQQIPIGEYDQFAQNHPLSSVNQSAKWSQIKYNWIPFHTGLYEDNVLVAVALVLIRPLPLGFRFAYLPRGPLVDFSNKQHLTAMISGLKQLSKKQHCLFVRMDPKVLYKEYSLEAKETAQPLVHGVKAIDDLIELGGKHLGLPIKMHDSFQPRYVANTYFSDTFEEDLPRRTKRFLKDANKYNVSIRIGDVNDLDEFIRVLGETESRKNIALRSKEYHQLLLETYGDDAVLSFAEVDLHQNFEEAQKDLNEVNQQIEQLGDNAPKKRHLLLERQSSLMKQVEEIKPLLNDDKKKQVLSGMLSIKYGNTFEHLYAGFDKNFKKYMPQYRLYVEMMKYGFSEGYYFSNMGGIEGTLDDGLTQFKAHFNPMINEYIGEFDFPTSKLYPLFMIAWNIRNNRRR